MTKDMNRHYSFTGLMRFTLPTIAMMIFTSLYTVVDGIFISNFVSKTALAAVNLIWPALMIFATIGLMVGTGGSALVAKTRGEGDDARANRYFSMLVEVAAVLGIILAVVACIAMEPLSAFLGATGQLFVDTATYGFYCALALPFFILQFAFQSFFITAGKPQLGLAVIVAAGVTNVALDALFICGFGWGVAGGAIATALGQVVGGGIPLIYFFRKNSSSLRLSFTAPQLKPIAKSCLNGLSEMVSNIAMNVVAVLYNFQLLAYIGEDGVAAYSVILYTAMVFSAIFMGYSIGAAPLMSYQYGAHNHREMHSILWKSLGFVSVAGVIMFLAAQWLAGPLSYLFVSYDPELLDLTVGAYKLYAFAFLVMGIPIYGSSFFTALNNGVVSAIIAFVRTLIFEVGAVLLLPLVLGINGIWLSVSVAELAAAIMAIIFMVALRNRYGYSKKAALAEETKAALRR